VGLTVGLAGAGRIGAFHARVLASHPRVGALLIADPDVTRAQRTAAEVGGRCFESPTGLVEAGIDALVIAATTPSHEPLIRLAAAARLPVFCEKPIALDLDTVDAVLEEVDRAGVMLQIGFQRRFDPAYRAAHQAVRSGQLGDLYLLRVADHDPTPPPEEYVPASGGIWRDFMVHDFDAIPWVTGQEIVEVYADGRGYSDLFARNQDIHHGAALLRLAEGAMAVASTSRHDPRGYDVRMELFGSADSITVGLDERTPLRSMEPGVPAPRRPEYRDFMERFDAAYRMEMNAFLRSVEAGRPEGCTGMEARRGLLVAMAAERSLAEHRPVAVGEIG
jgi:myo-inositol 2-dehydrogenase / D-chiro-inositol 1-dehydrogenase